MEQESVISQNILRNMSGGVMTIDLKGQITTFNPAASRILGFKEEEAIGKRFAELFFEYEGNDDFNQAILDAIYESSTSHNRTVDFNTGKRTISLTLTTSFLQNSEDGKKEKLGVIAVFDDITEVKKLRDAEVRLTEEIKSSHRELQAAYLKMEEGNRELEAALKKVQAIRIGASLFAIIFFLVIGIFTWNKKLIPSVAKGPSTAAAQKQSGPKIFTVTAGPISSSLSMTGTLDPLHIVNMTSPLAGTIKELYFRYGDIVSAGQVLLKMDASEVEMKYRDAKAAYIKALDHYNEVEHWDKSADVARTQRSLTKTKLTLESLKKNFEETERLYKKGIVPENEYEGAKQQYAGQQLDLQSAEEEMRAVISRGNGENRKIAKLEMENAQAKLREAEQQLSKSTVNAPVTGVILLPGGDNEGKASKVIGKGTPLQQGELLFSIGDLSGFSVKSRADEVDVTKIHEGQKVTVTGDAFTSMPLSGRISRISSQAGKGADGGGGAPSFGIVVSIDKLTPEQRKKIFVGMSASLDVVIYERPDALMVPVSTVTTEGEKRFVMKRSGGANLKTEVRTGYTTVDSVEITAGLKPGDEVIIDQ